MIAKSSVETAVVGKLFFSSHYYANFRFDDMVQLYYKRRLGFFLFFITSLTLKKG